VGSLTISLGRRGLGVLGIASVAIILGCAAVTAIPYRGYAGESYSPLNHFISELGEIAASRLAWLFNLGLVTGGAGLAAFLFGISGALDGRLRRAFQAFAGLAGATGMMCGLYPMDYLTTHRVVTVGFFLTGWLVAATFTVWLARSRSAAFPRWLVVPGLGVVAVFVVFIAVYSTYHPANPDARILTRSDVWTVPLLEWASLVSLLGWFVCVAATLFRHPTD